MLLPIAYLLLRALEADPALLGELVWRSRNLQLLLNTLALTFGVLAAATVMAFPLAWLVTRTDIAGARLITILGVLPLAVPGYVMAYALIGLGGNYGMMNQVFGIVMPRPQGLWGAVAALSLYTFPYLFLNLRAALSGMDRSLEETARSLGHGPWAVLSRVTMPHLVPALLAGWLVIGLYTLGDFGAVALMRYEVFSYAIYTQYAGAFDRIYAAWLSLMLIALTLCFVLAEPLLFGRRRYARVGTGTARPLPKVRLGPCRWLAYGFVAAVFLASIGLPVAILAYWLNLAWPPTGLDQLGPVFLRSALAAGPAALGAAVVALPIAYLCVRYPSGLSRMIERAAYLGYAIPPLTLALAMVFFSLRSAPWLYQTLTLLIATYIISFLALALGPIRAALLQARPSLEEAARSLGYSSFGAFVWIVLPLVRRGALTGMILVFVIAMKELPITFLLAPTGYTTLAVTVFSRTSEAMLAEAAPFAAAIVLFSSLFVGVLLAYEGKR
ncbi:MAG: iron ABC transporter permease [Rhodospirillales bacterium]|nr:MAG: iron ABC transporter permease [Rhodospirillales bacterium]